MIKSYISKLPRLIRLTLVLGLLYLVLMTLMRLALFFFFPNQGHEFGEVTSALLLGLRYDLRAVSIIMLGVMVFGSVPKLFPFASKRRGRAWLAMFGVLAFFVLLVYAIDFAHFSY